jgi:hypothetical protein
MKFHLFSFLLFSFAGFTANFASAKSQIRDSWGNCFPPFTLIIQNFSSPISKDCGVLGFGAASLERGIFLKCAKKAFASQKAYRLGYGGTGIDSGYCDAAVRTSDGQLWQIRLDYDFSFPQDDPRSGPSLLVARCTSVDVSAPENFGGFNFTGCIQDEDGFKKIQQVLRRENGT